MPSYKAMCLLHTYPACTTVSCEKQVFVKPYYSDVIEALSRLNNCMGRANLGPAMVIPDNCYCIPILYLLAQV
jgi:hypothetical protein